MFAATTYEEIIEHEKMVENKEIVVFLFAKSTDTDVLNEFEYIHYNSAKYCTIYAIGYTDDFTKKDDGSYRKVNIPMQNDWYFSVNAFVDFKNKLEDRINWKYSGETELLILQNKPLQSDPLDFNNYVAIDVYKGIKEGYMDSFQRFMESLVRSARKKVTAKDAINDIRKSRISVKEIIAESIDDCKRISAPYKKILKDRLFYRCGNIIKK